MGDAASGPTGIVSHGAKRILEASGFRRAP